MIQAQQIDPRLEFVSWLTERSESERAVVLQRLAANRPDVLADIRAAVFDLVEFDGGDDGLGGFFDSIASVWDNAVGTARTWLQHNDDTIAAVVDAAAVAAPYAGYWWATPVLAAGSDWIKGDSPTLKSVAGNTIQAATAPSGNWWDGLIRTAQTYLQPVLQDWLAPEPPKAPQQPQYVVAGGGTPSWLLPAAIAGGALLLLRK